MKITRLRCLTDAQVGDMLGLMGELDPEIEVTKEDLLEAIHASGSYVFAAIDEQGHIAGCATLCVYVSPTGRKASIEDVVVRSSCRGQHLGRRLMEQVLDFARAELGDVVIHLTSRPSRTAANELYRSLGFRQRNTNVYQM